MADHTWRCVCGAEQTDDAQCQVCERMRFASWEIQISEHVLEHIADGISDPLSMLKAMNERPCYTRLNSGRGFTLQFIVQRIRMLTKDTRSLAEGLMRARSAQLALEAIANGTPADKIRMLEKWGPATNAEQHHHTGEVVQRQIIHVHDGPPPKQP